MAWVRHCKHSSIKDEKPGTSPEVQELRICASVAGAWVQSLMGKLGSCTLCGTAKNKEIKTNLKKCEFHKKKKMRKKNEKPRLKQAN